MTTLTKTCSKCQIAQNITNFSVCKRLPSGLSCRCKDCDNKYYIKNKEHHLKRCTEWANKNSERSKEIKRKSYLKNKEKYKIQQQIRRQENKEELCIYHRNYKNNRKKIDINYKLAMQLRTRLYNALKGQIKNGSAVKDLGCTIQELKVYLENQFLAGMNWNNHTLHGWHIDHIIPLSSFDLTDREQFLKANHYTNLRPMWSIDNLSKHAKII